MVCRRGDGAGIALGQRLTQQQLAYVVHQPGQVCLLAVDGHIEPLRQQARGPGDSQAVAPQRPAIEAATIVPSARRAGLGRLGAADVLANLVAEHRGPNRLDAKDFCRG